MNPDFLGGIGGHFQWRLLKFGSYVSLELEVTKEELERSEERESKYPWRGLGKGEVTKEECILDVI